MNKCISFYLQFCITKISSSFFICKLYIISKGISSDCGNFLKVLYVAFMFKFSLVGVFQVNLLKEWILIINPNI